MFVGWTLQQYGEAVTELLVSLDICEYL